ncbi:MAG: ABC transporter substrate-binding protein, partial [Actinobacteria bacterium]
VGAILSMTGNYAALGDSEKKALDLEVKRINDAGGVAGRKLELIIEDDATDEAKAVSAAAKLLEQDKVVAIIGASGTGQSMAIRGDVDRAGVPQLSMAGGNAITAKLDPLVFQTPWPNKLVVPFVLKRMKEKGFTKIGVMTDTGGYGKDGLAIIKEEAPKLGIAIVSEQTFNPNDTDMTAQLTKIKGSEAQAVLIWSASKDATTVLKNSQQIGLKLPFFGGSGQARTQFVEGAGTAANGFEFGTGKILLPESWGKETPEYKAAADFISRYEAAYSAKPDIFAGHAYDAVWILADALKRTEGDTDPAKLRDAIEQTKDMVGMGGKFTFSASDHNGLTENDLFMYRVENGAWVPAR